ncbi:hypothetical protein ACH42_09415 [Endozoicomonas sp. (ex Bugula neritina AB1)]|nr:hypothetical protein ACH42_09415 [Endozoicomonas sp. (ex Bugula neritina AB1)]
MTISLKLQSFLNDNHVEYEVVSHPYSERALDTAHAACVPVKNMAKAVLLEDREGYVMAIVPSVNKVILPWINNKMDRHLHLATEQHFLRLFPDCEEGSVPAVGIAYGLRTCWDDELNAVNDLYLEGGNHRELIHLQREQFKKLLEGQPHAAISCDPDEEETYTT